MSFLIIVPLILSIFIFRRKPLLCLRNVAVAGVLFPLVIGTILFPYSLQFDILNISNYDIFENSTKKAMLIISLGLVSFVLSILLFDMIFAKSTKKISFPTKITQLIAQFKNTPPLKVFAILVIFTLVGTISLFTVFYKMGYIPFCNIDSNVSDRYFRDLTAIYIPLRPLYILGQHILAITGFIILLYIFSVKSIKRTLLFMPLFIITFFCLLLTAKRGELVYPFVMLIGSFILLSKINLFDFFRITLALLIVCYLVIILDPSYKRSFAYNTCSVFYSALEMPHQKEKLVSENNLLDEKKIRISWRLLKFFVDTFGIQVRETSRLLYHFNVKGESFYYGKTFIAGFLSFIPTSKFPFKERNYFGRVSQRLFDNNPETAGGPNIGLIGESYINFGFIGVIILPFLIGILVWYLDSSYFSILQNEPSGGIITMGFFFYLLFQLVFMSFQVGSTTMQAFIIRSTVCFISFFFFCNTNRAKLS